MKCSKEDRKKKKKETMKTNDRKQHTLRGVLTRLDLSSTINKHPGIRIVVVVLKAD